MDYTTVANVKAAIGASATGKDALLARLVTAASRAVDRMCAGAANSDNYFALSNVAGELLTGQVDSQQHLVCWPRKPVVNSVAVLSYRASPLDAWTSLSTQYVSVDGYRVTSWETMSMRGQMQVEISYNGGLAATVEALPADIIEAATVLAARWLKEAATGLADAIGVDELGTLVYTKAVPARVREMLQPYKRLVP